MRLRLADGRELIDGMSSWWCAIHGYRHPVLDEAVREQLGRMAHVMFGGLTHEGGVRLAERLLELAPAGLGAVFFAESSTAWRNPAGVNCRLLTAMIFVAGATPAIPSLKRAVS